MKKNFVFLFFIFLSASGFAQTKDSLKTGSDSSKVKFKKEPDADGNFVIVDEMPDFPGGLPALYKFIGDHVNYPKRALKKKIQGRCYIRFVVKEDGTVGKTEVQKGVPGCSECDEEAVKAIKQLPAFVPGKSGGKTVPVWFQLPINFTLN